MGRPNLGKTAATRLAAATDRRARLAAAGAKLVQITLDADCAQLLADLAQQHPDRRGRPSPSAAVTWLLRQLEKDDGEG